MAVVAAVAVGELEEVGHWTHQLDQVAAAAGRTFVVARREIKEERERDLHTCTCILQSRPA